MGLRVALGIAVALPLVGSEPASALRPRGRELDVMTFNLRYASDREPNSWADRRPVMRELLRRAAPHVIGTQEGIYQQLRDIAADLGPSYDWIGTGRRGGSEDEQTAVFYDNRRLAPVAYDHFWLSDTPKVIGSNTWGADHPRIVTWVRFRDLGDAGQEFYVLNTHLDNASGYARTRSAALIAERLHGFDRRLPVVVTGDFNCLADDPVHATLLAAGLVDAWDAAAERGPSYATFHGFEPPALDDRRIDWILVTPGVTAQRAAVDLYHVDGQYPSDHLPVRVSLTLS
ncbi:endonuclease/exonuclease/phosphatase family protein [Streptomyces mangrovisoli]|uniref:Endonuclease n=1 Tax=Streptomyces mangrovisoli TaxID=1428628 RepID=A0A1J4P248_9ACTN|nr:endonuclease/exonuclease/phosphatase family protein [Streptomyces mangrovisoli]OIJ68648.1 endonuclease [Streptomyces mangrovisoli]